jgi:type IV secretory pathway VirB4 component
VKVTKLRATTAEWQSVYPWHFGGSIPSIGPVLGVDRLAGGSPFGLDPLRLVIEGHATNPNMVVAGAPGNGKSAFVKALLWNLVGAFGYRFVATDVKGEYRAIAAALGVPVLDLRPGGPTRINPLHDPDGRQIFCAALASLCLNRSLESLERAALAAAVRALPPAPVLGDLLGALRDMPAAVCDELVIDRADALTGTQALRFGLGELLNGAMAGMFDGQSNIEPATSPGGFVVDVSGCGSDDRVLRFAMLAGQRAVSQMLATSTRPTVRVNDEGWRVASTMDGVRYMQHDFKLGRVDGLSNILVVHRFAEIGAQADGVAGEIANRLVSDADLHVMFRQGDADDATDSMERLRLPTSTREALVQLPKHRCLIHLRGRLALLEVVLSRRMRALADTNQAVRSGNLAEIGNAA